MSAVTTSNLPLELPWHTRLKRQRFQCGVLQSFDTSHWIMIEPGLDDFRQGAPASDKGRIIPIRKDLQYFTTFIRSRTDSRIFKKSTDISLTESMITSMPHLSKLKKESTQKIGQTNVLDDFQNDPMALLPILEGTLPHDIFQKLCEILHKTESGTRTPKPVILRESNSPLSPVKDGGKRLSKIKNSSFTLSALEKSGKSTISLKKEDELLTSDHLNKQSTADTDSSVGLIRSSVLSLKTETADGLDPYRKFLSNSIGVTEKKRKKKPKTIVELPYNKIAEEFCKWASEMEGEQDMMQFSPEMLMTLFSVNRDYSVFGRTEIKILDSLNIPKQLMALDSLFERQSRRHTAANISKLPSVPKKTLPKYRYGSWYLSVDKWKKQLVHEKILDPDELKKKEALIKQLENPALDETLRTLYSTKKFQEFLQAAKLRMPHCLRNIPVASSTSKSMYSHRSFPEAKTKIIP